jgi:hypothetical protein
MNKLTIPLYRGKSQKGKNSPRLKYLTPFCHTQGNFLVEKNFAVWSVDRVMGDLNTGETYQLDITFIKKNFYNNL